MPDTSSGLIFKDHIYIHNEYLTFADQTTMLSCNTGHQSSSDEMPNFRKQTPTKA
jgi:hypothetical protein